MKRTRPWHRFVLSLSVLGATGAACNVDTSGTAPNSMQNTSDAAAPLADGGAGVLDDGGFASGDGSDGAAALDPRAVVQITAAFRHTCALFARGRVKCWGNDNDGELGQGDTQPRGNAALTSVAQTPEIDLGALAVQISAGNHHVCARLVGNTVKCWGANDSGQLGQNDTAPRGKLPAQMGSALAGIFLGRGATYISANAEASSCAVLDDGNAKCWGSGANGALGRAGTSNLGDEAMEMEMLNAINFGNTPAAVEIGASATGGCVRFSDSTVKCWGSIYAYGDVTNRGSAPNQMGDNLPLVDLGTNRLAKRIFVGQGHACAILDNDQLKCWGDNAHGKLGLGNTNARGDQMNEMGDRLPAVDLGAGHHAIDMALGYEHTCALLENHTVRCWGYGLSGQRGAGDGNTSDIGNMMNEMGDALAPVDLGTGRTAVQLAAGYFHTCALLDDASVKCWGRNDQGQLGISDTEDRGDGPGEMGDALPAIRFY